MSGVCVAWCPILDKVVEVNGLEVILLFSFVANVVLGVGVAGFCLLFRLAVGFVAPVFLPS